MRLHHVHHALRRFVLIALVIFAACYQWGPPVTPVIREVTVVVTRLVVPTPTPAATPTSAPTETPVTPRAPVDGTYNVRIGTGTAHAKAGQVSVATRS